MDPFLTTSFDALSASNSRPFATAPLTDVRYGDYIRRRTPIAPFRQTREFCLTVLLHDIVMPKNVFKLETVDSGGEVSSLLAQQSHLIKERMLQEESFIRLLATGAVQIA